MLNNVANCRTGTTSSPVVLLNTLTIAFVIANRRPFPTQMDASGGKTGEGKPYTSSDVSIWSSCHTPTREFAYANEDAPEKANVEVVEFTYVAGDTKTVSGGAGSGVKLTISAANTEERPDGSDAVSSLVDVTPSDVLPNPPPLK
eukprot:CAMPEP_0184366190 /NCGR_PEP_ID=MMETSP1089-20130417/152540_1 /TAXON_ID=38269 ORGANISM="Gloeochaete wittrockiana, Strain SAG46.84" /NCGR_SAMPLE_ID=MMETSP1089 /ASSEMBLY_ACC=CAM_ASM_000445 /LENGTH=144 /DNA_ID=CAMNT_0026707685 /DNA_START=417 /DNA_END=851 /DNA_ORIENTATION=+